MFLKKSDTLIIIPVFNEEKNIHGVINSLLDINRKADILVINDGSSDETEKILKQKEINFLTHLFNLGIGVSISTGCMFALKHGYEYIVRMDGDGQHNPDFIESILNPLKNNNADVVIGSRFLGNSNVKSSPSRLIGILIISCFLRIITKYKITDPTSGFCAMNRKAFDFFSKNYAEDYPEPEIAVYHRQLRIKEVPITINKRHEGISSITPLKSLYYMVKVLISLFIHIFGKEEE